MSIVYIWDIIYKNMGILWDKVVEDGKEVLREFELGVLDFKGVKGGNGEFSVTATDLEDAIKKAKDEYISKGGTFKFADGAVIVATDNILIEDGYGGYICEEDPIIDNRPMTIIPLNRGKSRYY